MYSLSTSSLTIPHASRSPKYEYVREIFKDDAERLTKHEHEIDRPAKDDKRSQKEEQRSFKEEDRSFIDEGSRSKEEDDRAHRDDGRTHMYVERPQRDEDKQREP